MQNAGIRDKDGKSSIVRKRNAFTLVELMVVMALTGIAVVVIYRSFSAQQRVAITQSQVVEMQQELRAALEIMVREIRTAGYDITGLGLGFTSATSSTMTFTRWDDDVLPAVPRTISYRLFGGSLQRNDGSGFQEVAENIEALDFVYLDGNEPVPSVIGTPVAAGALGTIRTIQITVVARSDKLDQNFSNTAIYQNQQGTTVFTAPNDGYRRRTLTTTVECKNMGL